MPTRTIPSDGTRLFVCDEGQGLSLLMAHGMWGDHRAFDEMAAHLGTSYRTVRLDLRGHGRSDVPRRSWTVADLARDLRNILDALGIDRAVAVGHSLGGMAVLRMALDDPGRLRGLVLLGTSAEAESPERRSQLESLALALRLTGPSRWLVRNAAALFFSPDYARREPDRVMRWCDGVRSMPRRGLLQALEAVRTRPSLADRLDAVRIPTLVLSGTADLICDPAGANAMAARLVYGNHETLSGAGHALPMERPVAAGEAIRRFLEANGIE